MGLLKTDGCEVLSPGTGAPRVCDTVRGKALTVVSLDPGARELIGGSEAAAVTSVADLRGSGAATSTSSAGGLETPFARSYEAAGETYSAGIDVPYFKALGPGALDSRGGALNSGDCLPGGTRSAASSPGIPGWAATADVAVGTFGELWIKGGRCEVLAMMSAPGSPFPGWVRRSFAGEGGTVE